LVKSGEKKLNQTISVAHESWYINDERQADGKFCPKAKKLYKLYAFF
jgi:hypothetical protein